MAIPPSAGNPINVGPYKRIVGFHWPAGTPAGPTRYIRIQAWLWPLALGDDQVWGDPVLPWDGVAPPFDYGGDFQTYSIKTWAWTEWPFAGDTAVGGSRYFTRAEVYDATGALIADGICADLGISISKPTLPVIISVPQWTYSSISDTTAYPPQTVSVSNPMGLLFYTDGPIAKQFARGFLADPPVQYYRMDTVPAEMQTAMKIDRSTEYQAIPIDMSSVSAFFDGQNYSPIGWRWYQDGFTLRPRVQVLLKTVSY